MTIDIIPIPGGQRFPKERELDLTASRDIPAICGVHPYVSAMQIYAEKKGIVESQAETGRMRGGRWFEPAIFQALKDTPIDGISSFKFAHAYYRDSKSRIGCTPDFFGWSGHLPGTSARPQLAKPDTVIDGKFVSKPSWLKNWLQHEGEDDEETGELIATYQTPQIPIYIQFQNLVQVHHTGAQRGVIGALVHDSFDPDYPQLHPLELDMTGAFDAGGTWDFIEECAAEFWRKFERNEPPDVMPQLDAKLLNKLYPRDDGPALDLSDDLEAQHFLIEIEKLRASCEPLAKELKPQMEELKNLRTALKAIMGMSQKATCGPWDITCKRIERAPINATSYRDLRIKKRAASRQRTRASIGKETGEPRCK